MAKAGFCDECGQNVWLKEDGSCENGHSASSVSNVYEVEVEHKRLSKHSGLGIASFIISVANGAFLFLTILAAGILSANRLPAEMISNPYPGQNIIGLLVILGMFVSLVGFALGVVGVVQKGRKKIFSILGLIFNIGVVILVVLLMVIGMFVILVAAG